MMFDSPHYIAPEDRGDPVVVSSKFVKWITAPTQQRATANRGVKVTHVFADDGARPDQTLMVRCRKDEGFLIGVKQEEH